MATITQNMSTKGTERSLVTKEKISSALTKNRTKLLENVKDYILSLKETDFPSLTRCALYAGISEKALLALELRTADNSDLRILLDYIRDLQKASLMEGGLTKAFSDRMSTFLLQSNHGMKNEAPNLTQNNFISGISADLLAEAIELSRKKPAIQEKNKNK